ncbi:pre-mRNA-processing protein 40A-like [Iris pallida]|uniref:Pre-mRNA-processing protein 40A-like n=1 Tax=Iris pallida TaxID=29817 RepID=A0AAX6HN03_IRIPA|nr:pre-mRNA-processing protein 40A-like [Iris pallida]
MATVEIGDDNDAHECPVCLDDLRKTVTVMGEVKEMPGSIEPTAYFMLQVHEILKLLNQLIPPASRDVEDIQLVLLKEKILEDEPKFLN